VRATASDASFLITALRSFLIMILVCSSAACQSRVVSPDAAVTNTVQTLAQSAPMNTRTADGKWHSISVKPAPGLPRIHFYNKLNPVWWFKNIDDPVPPAWYKPQAKMRLTKWRLRNSFHNFTNYVIGIADKDSVRSGRYPEPNSNPHGGWNFAVSKYRWLRLPFLDYRRGKFEFYFGWREHGNFGIKVAIQ